VRTEEGRAWLRSRSPLYKVDQICRPLLIAHGRNDVRCKLQESEQFGAAKPERGLPVTYVVYSDEGHVFCARKAVHRSTPSAKPSWPPISLAAASRFGHDLTGSSLEVREGAGGIAGLEDALDAAQVRPPSRD